MYKEKGFPLNRRKAFFTPGRRRSGRSYCLPLDYSKEQSGGNNYQFVATKSVLARAISKEKLTKRGLVSVFDCYQKVHI